MKIKKVLIIEWTELPKNIKDVISDWNDFGKDRYISAIKEFSPEEYSKDMRCIEFYFQQQKDNRTSNKIEDFIREYGLEFDVWLCEQDIDFSDLDDILIHCWW